MKRLTLLSASTILIFGIWSIAHAVSIFAIQQGGTGKSTFTSGQLLYGNGTAALNSVATTTLSGSGPISVTTGAKVIGVSPVSVSCSTCLTGNQTITLSGAISGSGTTAITTTLANTTVTPGSYTSANLTVDQQGRITAASNGSSGGVTSIATNNGLTGGTITTTGTIGLASITANSVLANRTAGSAVPTALATSSLGIALSDTTGTLGIARGGTGKTSFTANQLHYGPFATVATTTVSCGTGATCSSFTVIGSSPITITATAGTVGTGSAGQFPFYTSAGTNIAGSYFAYASSTNHATILGVQAGGKNATTSATNLQMTAVGYKALNAQTTGINNSAFGSLALTKNTTGQQNSAFGFSALAGILTGLSNAAFGDSALKVATANQNSAFGSIALTANTTGSDNVGIGYAALTANIGGGSNVAVGSSALSVNTSGSENTGLGYFAGAFTTSGSSNVFVGSNSGLTGSGIFQRNTLVGAETNLNASNPLLDTTSLGFRAGYNNTGWNSTFLGGRAGQNQTSGNNNIAIGWNALLPSTTASNQLNLGNIIFGSGLTATSTSATVIPTLTGTIGIGTTTPWAKLSVVGNATPVFVIASSTVAGSRGALFEVDRNGHIISTGKKPALSSCGTTPTITGNDADMIVTVGSVSATGCTITFANAYASTPTCSITNLNMSIVNALTATISTSAITLTQTALTGSVIDIMCHEPHS